MSIFDRLGFVIKSYLHDDGEENKGSGPARRFVDPDILEAEAELDEFLEKGRDNRRWEEAKRATAASAKAAAREKAERSKVPRIPEELRADFAELEVAFGASSEECKVAYKRLLKIHHPDRHTGNPESLRKATEKSARINTAFERIERWRSVL